MFIVCTDKQADKKCFKRIQKIIISKVFEDIKETETITVLNSFLPDMDIFNDYIDHNISCKKYYKTYAKRLRHDENKYATLVLLMLGYVNSKDILLVCSADEMKFGYMNFLAKVMHEDFGVEIQTYEKWKEKGKKFGKCVIDKDKLKKATKEYRYILEGEPKKKKDKDKKKKKGKKKNKKNKSHDKAIDIISEFKKPKKKQNKKKKSELDEDGFLLSKKHVLFVRKIQR